MSHCHFIPPYLLHRVAASQFDVHAARCGHATLAIDEQLRSRRLSAPPLIEGVAPSFAVSGEDAWTIHSAGNGSSLPGTPVRSTGEPPSGDPAVDEAYAGTEASVGLFEEVYERSSYDDRGAPVVVTVHYERDYGNAFWDGRQLVFGDGDGRVFERFTKPIDVLAHEFTHAVVQYTAGLVYQGQSGALNESISDVFAACVKQRVLGQSAGDADWLIGEGIFTPSINGPALRSMSHPGTAYDDPVLGRDPQVAHMSAYVHTSDDNGGVHLNSGIPNRAFYLAARAWGGPSWEKAGRVWYSALTSGSLRPDADFATFAAATIQAARDLFGDAHHVVDAWAEVGVTRPGDSVPSGHGLGAGSTQGRVAVRRSGGFAGQTVTGEVELGADPRSAEVEQLLARIDLREVTTAPPQPDRFVYLFSFFGEELTVAEQALTPELSRLASIVLER